MRVAGKSDLLDLELIVVRETAKAIFVKDTELSDGVWLPKSQLQVDAGATGVTLVSMPQWLAIEKGLA